MNKNGWLLVFVISLLFLVGCAQVSEEELAKELGNLSEEELQYVLSEDTQKSVAGQAYQFSQKELPNLQRLKKEVKQLKISCSDSDGGANYQKAGYVTLLNYPGGAVNKSDKCWGDGKRLQEYVCEEGRYKGNKTFDCSDLGEDYVCQENACTYSPETALTCSTNENRIVLPEETRSYIRSDTGRDLQDFCLSPYEEIAQRVGKLDDIFGAYNNDEVRAYYAPTQTYVLINLENCQVENLVTALYPATSKVKEFQHLVTDGAILLHEVGAITLLGQNFPAGKDLDYITERVTAFFCSEGYELNSTTESDLLSRVYIDERWVGAFQNLVISNYFDIETWVENIYPTTNDWLRGTQFVPLIDRDYTPTIIKRLHLAKELKRMYEQQALTPKLESERALAFIAFTTHSNFLEQGGYTFTYLEEDQKRAGMVMLDTGVFSHEFGHIIDLTDIIDDNPFFAISYNGEVVRNDSVPEDFMARNIIRGRTEDFAGTYETIAKFGFEATRNMVSDWASGKLLQKIDWMEENVFPSDYVCISC